MILNLRDINLTPKMPLGTSFICHGTRFTATSFRNHEDGYQDAMGGHDPQSGNVDYRRGFLEFLESSCN